MNVPATSKHIILASQQTVQGKFKALVSSYEVWYNGTVS